MTIQNQGGIKNFHHREFSSAALLAEKKAAAGLSISLVIPALNEAATIGPIIATVVSSLVRGAALVDEVVVIDGGSNDETGAIAEGEGARVCVFDGTGPATSCSGKGAALWKSQFVTTGELIVFVDADILNFGAHFVTGLLGPLLLDDGIYFVKGYYRRPLRIETAEYEHFGGRVTELLVRPMLGAFAPELGVVHQPLGGEYAFRRSALEELPFASGYGVEIGLLFDFCSRFGAGRMAEVDLERRVHRNRPVAELGRMADGVLQVMMKKLEERKAISLHRAITTVSVPRNGSSFTEAKIEEQYLPPRCMVRG